VTAFLSFLSRTLEYFKTQEIKNTGKDELKKEILEQDTKIQEKQTEILIKDENKNETIKKLENGTF
jgi:hypothetical protein